MVTDHELPDHPNSMNLDYDVVVSHTHEFEQLSHQNRQSLLDGPSVLLVTLYSGILLDYDQQCAAAKRVVQADRTRQLVEQAESNSRSFIIEFPARALAAASQAFRQGYEANPGVSRVVFDMGNILPGYTMSVLDWYTQALRSKRWFDFVPEQPSMSSEDKWYWLYGYAAMRSLGMHDFAGDVQQFIEHLIDYESLTVECESYVHLLRALRPSDPLVAHLARRTAERMLRNTLLPSQGDCDTLAEAFPYFATQVGDAYQSNASTPVAGTYPSVRDE